MGVDVPLPVEPTPLHPVDPPGPTLAVAACVERVEAAVEALAAVTAVRHELSTSDLAALTRSTLAVLQLAESATVGLVTDAMQRGLVSESTAAGPAQWVGRLAAGEPVTNLLPETGPNRTSGPLIPLDDEPTPDAAEAAGGGLGADSSSTDAGASEGADSSGGTQDDAGAAVASDVGPTEDECGRVGGCRVPGLEPGTVSRIAKVAQAATQRRHAVIADAIAANLVGVAAARTALVEVEKLLPILPASTHEKVYRHFLALPPGSGSRAIRELSARVVATFADEDSIKDRDEKLDDAESVTWSNLPNGMERLIADLTPFHAAQLRHALNALSAPAPGNTCCGDPFHRHAGEATGEPDPRSAAKRAADALMMLIATAAAALIDDDTQVPSSGQAKIVVTIDLDTLTDHLFTHQNHHSGHPGHRHSGHDPAGGDPGTSPPGTGPRGTGPPGSQGFWPPGPDHPAPEDSVGDRPTGPGFGRTEDGTAIDAHHVRQLACDADILPMILGSHGEPLDVGRQQRLVKNGMRAAVIERDRHCTYPGCSRPPAWCHIHHVIPWQLGGPTSVSNSALLCPGHHTIVHRDEYTAIVTATGVTWDLTPRRMRSTGRLAG